MKNGKAELTIDDLIEQYNKQKGACYWFNIALIPHQIFDKSNPRSMSVDRLDNDKGYTKDNIVITSRAANLARNNTSAKDFTLFVQEIKDK